QRVSGNHVTRRPGGSDPEERREDAPCRERERHDSAEADPEGAPTHGGLTGGRAALLRHDALRSRTPTSMPPQAARTTPAPGVGCCVPQAVSGHRAHTVVTDSAG